MTQLSPSRAIIVYTRSFFFSTMGFPRSNASLSGSSMIFFQRLSTLTVWLTSLICWMSLNTNRFCFRFASLFTTDAWNNWLIYSSWSTFIRLLAGWEGLSSCSCLAGDFAADFLAGEGCYCSFFKGYFLFGEGR
jgi:hypothetical protein